ncbi:MAG: hypothetical protein JWN69_1633 [Alphaproteobacteria bacterium]|nr:hypothetical protein [Alphaproteobacteria bacterium]
MRKVLIPSTALALCLAVACNRSPNASGSGPPNAAVPTAQAPAQAPGSAATPPASRQLQAAEPFEALTETAFSATPPELGNAVTKAEAAAAAIMRDLPTEAAGRLADQVQQVKAEHAAGNRAGIALASVEAYRTLVTAAPPAHVPNTVNLLDYAGFRYQAELRAQPVRWNDAVASAAFAQSQWDQLMPKVTEAVLKVRVTAAVNDLKAAAASRDGAEAERAANAELALVDELETYFNSRPVDGRGTGGAAP